MADVTPREYIPTVEEMKLINAVAAEVKLLLAQQEGMVRMMLHQQGLEGKFSWKDNRLLEEL